MREQGFPVTVADLDIVNPYFRTLDSEAVFREHGIKLICSQFANSNVDAPAMPKEVYNLIDSRSEYGVLDIGGDDRGALALGRYVPSITEENDYEMLLVINKARPLTRNVPDTVEVVEEMVKACIVLTKGTEPTDELKKEIQNYVKTHTAPYKYPRIVEFRTELPKTTSGKIIRSKL